MAAASLILGMVAASSPAAAADLHLFAATTLRAALSEVVASYEHAQGGHVVVAYAPTPVLAKQIQQGAPADVFISADAGWMDYLAERHLIRPASRIDLLGNRLVLVGSDRATTVGDIGRSTDLASVVAHGRLAMCDPSGHPAGQYAKASLETLGLWKGLSRKLAIARDPAAAVLLVARGEAPAGVVFATDAEGVAGVKIIGTFPAASHPPIVYPAAIVAGSVDAAAAAGLLAYLRSPPATAVFARFGYGVPQ